MSDERLNSIVESAKELEKEARRANYTADFLRQLVEYRDRQLSITEKENNVLKGKLRQLQKEYDELQRERE